MIVDVNEPITRRGARITRHYSTNDWCHLCGTREVNLHLAYVDYPMQGKGGNAEHKPNGPRDGYIRICSECGILIHDVANGFDSRARHRKEKEHRYRMGAHQALAMMLQWIEAHPDAKPLEAMREAVRLARVERSNVPDEGRQPGDFLMDRILDQLKP